MPSWEQELRIRVVGGRGLRAWLDRAVEYGMGWVETWMVSTGFCSWLSTLVDCMTECCNRKRGID